MLEDIGFSDHFPLLIETENAVLGRRPYRFHFKAWWTLEESCEAEIRKLWEESSSSFLNRMVNLTKGLKVWVGKIRHNRNREVNRFNKRLKELNCEERLEENLGEIVEVKLHLNVKIDKEERYWEQRACANWLQMGDKNTAFFHKYAS
ncbi:hypothetical protein PVK06_005046 [Gossypium arboreum]|uniref:Reverse transcriptase n=2 Tax=Gossypium arboreum TaxID=29729 RepID=A0ABR0QTK6_GOSAR|nr:hypothetical protein PVK06_005046 [Gossypium arboreum]